MPQVAHDERQAAVSRRARAISDYISGEPEVRSRCLGIELLIEPINSRVDIPGYLLDHTDVAMELIERAARSNIKLQYDVYHMQIMEGDLARSIERLLPYIGHIQIAGNPGRREPDVGEVNYERLLARIEQLDYDGWIGCEYKPRGRTADGLSWAQRYLARIDEARG